MAAGQSIDETITIDETETFWCAMEHVLGINIDLNECLDSKDLFDTLSTYHAATDKSIGRDISSIQYEFETRKINWIMWVTGKKNLADPFIETEQLFWRGSSISTSHGLWL